MLAQNFKTAAELGISDTEQAALVKVLGFLERDDLPDRLDMWRTSTADEDCGTPACICGWARRIAREDIFKPWDRDEALSSLFFTGNDDDTHKAINNSNGAYNRPDIAAQALRNFLTIGEPRWAEVLWAEVLKAR